MFQSLGNLLGRKTPPKGGPLMREPSSHNGQARNSQENKQVFSKVFRWRLPDGTTQEPKEVHLVGSFSQWQKVEMTRDGKLDAWHVTLHHIPGNKTHHYMLLVDGQPTYDKNCDGLAVPHGFQEEQYQLTTARGPRVLMLFAQTK
jgi:hypothetical protein